MSSVFSGELDGIAGFEDLVEFSKREIERYAKIVKTGNITVE